MVLQTTGGGIPTSCLYMTLSTQELRHRFNCLNSVSANPVKPIFGDKAFEVLSAEAL